MKKGMISILSMLTGVVIGASIVKKREGDKFEKACDKSNKHFELFCMMSQWKGRICHRILNRMGIEK